MTPDGAVAIGPEPSAEKDLTWVEEIAAGNIVKIQAHIDRDVRVNEVIYAREASNSTDREDK